MKFINWLKDNTWLIMIMLLASFLRFYHGDFQSFWLDEVLTMIDTKPEYTFKQFYDSVLFWEAFPHLYFLLLKYFMVIFGYSTMTARVFSGIIGIFGVFGIYLLGKELFNKQTGLIAAAITCVSIYHITYSQEARPYGMFFLFTVLSFYRLVIFIKNPCYRNAIFYGILSGLMINSHFFGLITLFSQFILLLFFLFKAPTNDRKKILQCNIVAGLILLALIIPTYQPLVQIAKIKSFWIPKPTVDSFAIMFKEFFGDSELQIFVINMILVYYFVHLFRQRLRNDSIASITGNKMILSFIILFVWFFVSLVIPIIKSYLDVSMILARYFINIFPVFIIAVAIGLNIIRSNIIRHLVLATVLTFSAIDLFVVNDYYNRPSKCQMRELTKAIKERNTDDTKIITLYSWAFEYWFKDRPDLRMESSTLPDYIQGMRTKAVDLDAFWYASVNPYELQPEDETYLEQNFIQTDKIEYFDSWARLYVPKNRTLLSNGEINLRTFNRVTFNENGNMVLTSNTNTFSSFIDIDRGLYELVINANSIPSPPINHENAHIRIKINGIDIADANLSDNPATPEKAFEFSNSQYDKIRIQLIYDNDIQKDGKDRNVIVYGIKIRKK